MALILKVAEPGPTKWEKPPVKEDAGSGEDKLASPPQVIGSLPQTNRMLINPQ